MLKVHEAILENRFRYGLSAHPSAPSIKPSRGGAELALPGELIQKGIMRIKFIGRSHNGIVNLVCGFELYIGPYEFEFHLWDWKDRNLQKTN